MKQSRKSCLDCLFKITCKELYLRVLFNTGDFWKYLLKGELVNGDRRRFWIENRKEFQKWTQLSNFPKSYVSVMPCAVVRFG